MSNINYTSSLLKLPLRLVITATLFLSYYSAYTGLVTWGVPIINTIVIGLYLIGVSLGRKNGN